MTVFEKLKIASQVALQWEREDYEFLSQAQAWEAGHDASENGILSLVPNDTLDVHASADPETPEQIEIQIGCEYFNLDMETGDVTS